MDLLRPINLLHAQVSVQDSTVAPFLVPLSHWFLTMVFRQPLMYSVVVLPFFAKNIVTSSTCVVDRRLSPPKNLGPIRTGSTPKTGGWMQMLWSDPARANCRIGPRIELSQSSKSKFKTEIHHKSNAW